jgi:hypothetical protein
MKTKKEQTLIDKAIDIKGKKYVLVSDRVLEFNKLYPNGCIKTEKLERIVGQSDRVEFRAIVFPNIDSPERYFTGHSQAVWGEGYINKTSALENAETSAVGRALAMMGIGVIDSIASVDEITKAKNQEKTFDPSIEKAPFCSYCYKEGIKMTTQAGYSFWTCPDGLKHRDEGIKFKMEQREEPLDKASQDFANSLK